MKTLVIAEKPDMGRTIARVIEPGAARRQGYLEGERYIITWAIGHLVSLAEPESYDAKYKKWRDEDLPILPASFKLQPNPRTKDQLKTIAELAKTCDRIVNACDAGREGQLIFHLIREYLKLNHPVDRLWISDLTPETIRRGFAELRSDREFDALTRAARARSQADWLIGMNASRAFTIRHRTLLSAGRVQTPVLALLYERHKEIEAFRPEVYYTVHGRFLAGETAYRGIRMGERLTSREAAEAIAGKTAGRTGRIAKYEASEQKEYPYRLYDLTLLQREANAKYGFSAKKTLDLAQSLYERHQVITYPRTSSRYVTEENIPYMHKALAMLRDVDPYARLADGADTRLVHRGNKAVCNPAKVEDHHAILPTPKKPGSLTPDERKLYDMIVRRFLSHYYPPAVYRVHEIVTEIGDEKFKTTVKEQRDAGWKVVFDTEDGEQGNRKRRGKSDREGEDGDEDGTQLITGGFALNPEAPVCCEGVDIAEKTTKPPKPYTEGTLLKAMESAGRMVEDEDLREAMKETGLGTPATRAATIERLKQVGYAALKGRAIEITPKGVAAVELIRGAGVELLTSPEMTGRWEQRLNQISRGEASDEPFMDNVRRFAVKIVELVRMQPPVPPGTFAEPERGGRPGRKGRTRRTGDASGAGTGRTAKKAADASGATLKKAKTSPGEPGSGAASKQAGISSGVSGSVAAATQARSASRGGGEARQPAAIAPCPRPGCGGTLIEGKRGFGCSRYREGCRFVIWKQSAGKRITAAMAASLAASGRTRPLVLTLPDGTKAKGRLRLADPATGEIAMEPE